MLNLRRANNVRKRNAADMLSSVESKAKRVLKKQEEFEKTILESRNELREELRLKQLSIAEVRDIPHLLKCIVFIITKRLIH